MFKWQNCVLMTKHCLTALKCCLTHPKHCLNGKKIIKNLCLTDQTDQKRCLNGKTLFKWWNACLSVLKCLYKCFKMLLKSFKKLLGYVDLTVD
jgi:hypothetical protein